MLNGILALCRGHATIKHDGIEPGSAQAPFDELQHGRKLREDDGFVSLLFASEFVEIVDQHLNLGRRCPVFHSNSIDDRTFLDSLLYLFNIGLLKVDRQRNVAFWAVDNSIRVK